MEKEIHDYIFDGMNKDIRPELEHGVPTHVHFDMKLQKIVNLVNNFHVLSCAFYNKPLKRPSVLGGF